MASFFCISIRFLQPYSHGRDESGGPEWPPSPLRMIQALVAASAGRWNERQNIACIAPAMQWLEALNHPTIIAPVGIPSNVPCQFYVPDNTADLVVPAWKKGELTKQPKRAEKVICPIHLGGEAVHYLYSLANGDCPHVDILSAAARSITHLGWGIDMVVGNADVVTDEQAAQLPGQRWQPSPGGGIPLRTHKPGTLDDLIRKHKDFLSRLVDGGFRPVPPLRAFDVVHYRREDEPLPRPCRIFELRRIDGSRFRYPHRRLIHIAGMVRHLAIRAMTASPPEGVENDWVETYVAGHAKTGSQEHRQISYLPLPSIGHLHANPSVRRVMLAASPGEEAWIYHVARRLAGLVLRPERGNEFQQRDGDDPPMLFPSRGDSVTSLYTQPANAWASVTPVILPGHDDHKPAKTQKLIEKALSQSGVKQPCDFEWDAFSRFPKSLSAHKYDRHKRPTGYIRPDHLLNQTAVHLTLRFKDGLKVPGPLAIGAGRHCGFGLMAGID